MTDKQKVLARFPKAYTFTRYAGVWTPSYDIVSEKDHRKSIVLGSSFDSYKEAWRQAADYVDILISKESRTVTTDERSVATGS